MALLCVPAVFANGTGEKGSAESGKTEITFWSLTNRQPALDPIIEQFNADNPDIHVSMAYYDTDGIKDACKVAASSGTLPNMWFNWGGSLGGFYSDNGLTYDMTEYAKSHGWYDKFTRGVMDLCTRNGKLTGYPTSFNALGIYYRKDIFAKYGIEIPKTFEEFEAACETLKSNGIIPITTAGKYGWHVMRFVELLIEHYAGAELHDSMNSFQESYDNPAVVKALEKYKEFVDKGYFPQGFLTFDPNDTKLLMYSKKAAMDIQGPWQDGAIISDGQDISQYGTFAFPSGGSDRLSAFAEMTQFNVNNTEAELDACVKFMDYYYSAENVEKYSIYYTLPLPRHDSEMPEGHPNVQNLLDLSNQNGTFTITDQAFPTQVADVLFAAQDAIASGQMTPAEGAANIQEAIDAYLQR